MAHDRLMALPDGFYEVLIDASLQDGHLTYGEYLHPGESDEEVLLSAHICHPSLANDNCSGLALLACLAGRIAARRRRYSYRFLFAPGTIGAITWLARNEAGAGRIKHGVIVAGVGDGGGPTYKKSRRGDALVDRAMAHVLRHLAPGATVLDFTPYGYDERQYCSPGFDLPVGLFQRSPFGQFPEYHSSADDLDFIRPLHLAASYRIIMAMLDVLERDRRPRNVLPKCEPQLGRRGVYHAVGGDPEAPAKNMALLWVLNLADGRHSLLDIAERAGTPFATIADAAQALREKHLLEDMPADGGAPGGENQAGSAAKSGQAASFSDITVGGRGQAMAKAGSS
jgi:aminopeptidase-like protein